MKNYVHILESPKCTCTLKFIAHDRAGHFVVTRSKGAFPKIISSRGNPSVHKYTIWTNCWKIIEFRFSKWCHKINFVFSYKKNRLHFQSNIGYSWHQISLSEGIAFYLFVILPTIFPLIFPTLDFFHPRSPIFNLTWLLM